MLQATALWLIVIGYMNIPKDMHRWRETTMRKFTKESTTYFVKGQSVNGMFRKCDQNRVIMCGKQRVSSQTVVES